MMDLTWQITSNGSQFRISEKQIEVTLLTVLLGFVKGFCHGSFCCYGNKRHDSGHHCVTNLCFTSNRFRGTTTGAGHPQFTRASQCQRVYRSQDVKICQDVMISQDMSGYVMICWIRMTSNQEYLRTMDLGSSSDGSNYGNSSNIFIWSRVTSHPACVEQEPEFLLPPQGNLESSRRTMGNPCCSKKQNKMIKCRVWLKDMICDKSGHVCIESTIWSPAILQRFNRFRSFCLPMKPFASLYL